MVPACEVADAQNHRVRLVTATEVRDSDAHAPEGSGDTISTPFRKGKGSSVSSGNSETRTHPSADWRGEKGKEEVQTIAGSGVEGCADGAATTQARLRAPAHVLALSADRALVADDSADLRELSRTSRYFRLREI